jgi:hypothetical protein
MTQAKNNIFFMLDLGTGKVSRFRTVAAVTDRRYIQNNSTIIVWIDCWPYITRRTGKSLWGVTLCP